MKFLVTISIVGFFIPNYYHVVISEPVLQSGIFSSFVCQLNLIVSENLINSPQFELILTNQVLQISHKSSKETYLTLNLITTISFNSSNNSTKSDEEDEDEENVEGIVNVPTKGSCLNFLIFSSDFKENSKAIKNSGFGFSETVLFYNVFISEESESSILLGYNKEEESEDGFPKFHAPLVFIRFQNGVLTKFSIYCYICPSSEKFNWISISLVSVPNRLETLEIHKNLNWYGHHGIEILVQSQTNLDISSEIEKFPQLENCQLYFESEPKCNDLLTLWEVLKLHLNITKLTQIDDYYDDFKELSLKVCLDCIIAPEIQTVGSRIYYFDDKLLQFLYCEKVSDYEDPSWLFFIEPFDVFIWFGILTTATAAATLHRDFAYAIDTLLILINQQCRKKWSLCLSITMLAISLLSQEYQSYMTANVTAPPQPAVITKIKEIFDLGYRFILPDESFLPLAKAYSGDRITQLGITRKNPYIFDETIDQFNNMPQTSWYHRMAETKGLIGVYSELHNHLGKKNMAGQKLNASCHIIEEYFKKMHYQWIMRSILSERLSNVFKYVKEASLDSHFYKRYVAKIFRLNNKRESSCNDSNEECADVKKLSLQSSIQILLILYLIASFVGGIVLIYEILK